MASEDYKNIQHSDHKLDTERFTYKAQYDGVNVYLTEHMKLDEVKQYIKRGQKLYRNLKNIFVEVDGEEVVLYYNVDVQQPGFERIRRITGYLVGTLDRFNDAKAAEERARVKHEVS